MTQPGALRFPLVLRCVPAGRELVARAALPNVASEPGQTWWELVDAAGDDARPPSAVAVTTAGPERGRVMLLAASGQSRRALVTLVDDLLAALSRTSAHAVFTAGSLGLDLRDVLTEAGFGPLADACDSATPRLHLEL